ncbi:MAG: hypothetical protein ACLQVG_07815 [Terriglobia bacterium]
MRIQARALMMIVGAAFTLLVLGGGSGPLGAKDKSTQVSSDDPTLRLYSLLDSKYNGKLDEFYLLADVANDPKNPGQAQQHVLRVDYGKDRVFGKLHIQVRTVAQLTPDQLKTYSPKQIYEFAENDTAKFTKTDPGPLGKPGDVYFQPSSDGGALATATVTPEIQAEYDQFVTQYLMPALEKKAAGGSGS